MAKASKMAENTWNFFRSASGLALAERVREMQARKRIKAGEDLSEVWEADFEPLAQDIERE